MNFMNWIKIPFPHCCSCPQRWPSAIGIGHRRLFGVSEYLCIELRTSKWLIAWRRPRPQCNRSQLARSGHFLHEKVPWRCYRSAARAIASPISAILLRFAIGQNQNQLTSALLAIHHNRITAIVAAAWADRIATSRVAQFHQNLRRTQLRFHVRWDSNTEKNQMLTFHSISMHFYRHSCDTNYNAAIHLWNRTATAARRCDNSVLSNHNERTSNEPAANGQIIESRIDFLHAISYVCHYRAWCNVLSQRFRLRLWG